MEAVEMMDDETLRWLRDEAREEGDRTMEATIDRALVGNAQAIEECREMLAARVGRAHRAHRRLGHAPEAS